MTCNFALSGCLPFAVGGGAVAANSMLNNDRTPSEVAKDMEIWLGIKNRYAQYNSRDLFHHVTVKVASGNVMLTGSVEKLNTKMLAEKLAWEQIDVVDVVNQIEVGERQTFKDIAKDDWITAHIKTRLALEYGVRSGNYHISTINCIVYVLGYTKSQEELDTALNVIRSVSGVKKVISFVVVK